MKKIILYLLTFLPMAVAAQPITQKEMSSIYQEVRTPVGL